MGKHIEYPCKYIYIYPCNPWIFQQQHTHTTSIKTYFHSIWSLHFIQSTVYRPLHHQWLWPGAPSAQFPQNQFASILSPVPSSSDCPRLHPTHQTCVWIYIKGKDACMRRMFHPAAAYFLSPLHLPTCYLFTFCPHTPSGRMAGSLWQRYTYKVCTSIRAVWWWPQGDWWWLMTVSAFRSFKVAFLRSSHYAMPCHAMPNSKQLARNKHPPVHHARWMVYGQETLLGCYVSHSKPLWLVLQINHLHASTNLPSSHQVH